ncbi:MAG: hypothetical protein ACLUMK_15300, partial [Christensenellales bacterium]
MAEEWQKTESIKKALSRTKPGERLLWFSCGKAGNLRFPVGFGATPQAFSSNLLKRNPFRTAGDVDDAAAREAVFQNDVLHDRVVVVGVDAQVF